MTDNKPERTTRMLIKAAVNAGVRLVLSSGWANLGEGENHDFVYVTGPVSHERLFPLMAGIVHHGGAGTTAAAVRAGRPQTIVPHLLDQFFWAHHIEKLNLGPPGRWKLWLTERSLRRIFQQLTLPQYEVRAQNLALEIKKEDGLAKASKLIEQLQDKLQT